MYNLLKLDSNQNRWELFLLSVLIIVSVVFSFENFLLFHLLIELFSIVVGVVIFTVIYQSSSRDLSNYILMIGIGFIFTSFFDLLHTVTYDGMNLIDTNGANLATQLWIISRYFHSLTFLFAFYSFRYQLRLNFNKLFLCYLIVTLTIIILLMLNLFPDCYIEGSGLTTFKIVSEFIISLIFIGSLYFIYLSRYELNNNIYKGLLFSILIMIFSELAFTVYINVYSTFNIIGHVFKFISYYLISRVVLTIVIKQPHEVLYGNYKATERRFNLLLNRSNMTLCHWDIHNKTIIFDKNGALFFGDIYKRQYTEEEFYSLVHPEDLEKFKYRMSHLDQLKDISINAKFRIKTQDHEYLWYQLEGITLTDGVIKGIDRIIFILKDITREKKLMNQLTIEKAKFEQLFDNANLGIALLNNDNKVMSINKQFQEMFGFTSQEVQGKVIDEFITPDVLSEEGFKNYKKVYSGHSLKIETIRQTKTNNKIDVAINAFPIYLKKDTIGIYAIYSDISQRKANERYIKYLSFHDELTGLFNRRYFENEINRLNKSRLLPIAIIMGDLNDLKSINDNYGHSKGDKYLKLIGDILKNSIRSEDILARVGGDEFAIILPKADKFTAEKIIGRITNECAAVNEHLKMSEKLSISLGYSIKREKSDNLVEVFNEADRIMYKVKDEQKYR